MFTYPYLELLKFGTGRLEMVRDKPFGLSCLLQMHPNSTMEKRMGLHATFEYL